MRIAVIGCGLRTPLLVHGVARSGLGITNLRLYDIDSHRAEMMAFFGAAIARDSPLKVEAAASIDEAARDSSFVISGIRVGGIHCRARDERLAMENGFAGQETTGPAGFAMALRTVPVAIKQAKIIEAVAPGAWIVNFTNPAGLVTQAITTHTGARVVGVCDTPAELFFRIALALGAAPGDVECDYFGLNHLGWVKAVRVRGKDVTGPLLSDEAAIRRLYPARLFHPEMIRAQRLIPTEYLFYYYNQRTAAENQRRAAVTRAEELEVLNQRVLAEMEAGLANRETDAALAAYRTYLNRRNASYMRLEGSGESAFAVDDVDWDPFEGATGYHRIAVEAIRGLTSREPARVVLNTKNGAAIPELAPDDIVEVPCLAVTPDIHPITVGPMPDVVRGLVLSVKTFERLAIRAAVERSRSLAALALFCNPIVADWEAACRFVDALIEDDPFHFRDFTAGNATPVGFA